MATEPRQQLSDTNTRSLHRNLLLSGLPVTERRLQVAGVSTAVLEGGAGPPILLLHGTGDSADMWMRVIPDLVTTHRVVAPDLPGHGTSDLVDGRLDADGLRSWLSGLIERTCPSPPVLVGHVLGGSIGARFAVNHSDRLSRLVLVDSLGLARFRPAPKFALTMLAFLTRPTDRTYTRFMRQCSFDLDGLRHELGPRWQPFLAYSLERARGPNAKIAGRLFREFGIPPIPPDDLARIAVPTTLIWGRHDRASRLRIAQDASARYGWPLHVIEMPMTRPVTSRSCSLRHCAWRWGHREKAAGHCLNRKGGCRESFHPRIRIHGRGRHVSGFRSAPGPGATADHRHAPACGPSPARRSSGNTWGVSS